MTPDSTCFDLHQELTREAPILQSLQYALQTHGTKTFAFGFESHFDCLAELEDMFMVETNVISN